MRDRIKRIVGESGMGDRFLRRTFSTFQLTDDNKRAAAAARRYAEGFDAMLPQPGRQEPGRNGLFIAGPPGTGKTHLAAAIANHLIAQGKPVICMTMIVSSRAPVWGASYFNRNYVAPRTVSSRAPVWGASLPARWR